VCHQGIGMHQDLCGGWQPCSQELTVGKGCGGRPAECGCMVINNRTRWCILGGVNPCAGYVKKTMPSIAYARPLPNPFQESGGRIGSKTRRVHEQDHLQVFKDAIVAGIRARPGPPTRSSKTSPSSSGRPPSPR